MKRLSWLILFFVFCIGAGLGRAEELTRQQRLEKASRLYESGRKMVEQGEYGKAKEEFAKAQDALGDAAPREQATVVTLSPQTGPDKLRRADSLYNQAVVCIKNEEFRKAQACLEEAVELNPRDKDAYYNLGVIYEVFLRDRNEAARCYLRYVLLETDSRKAAAVKGWLNELKKGR